MTPCADTRNRRWLRQAVLALSIAAVLAGCAARKPRPVAPAAPATPPPVVTQPAKPPADKGNPEARFAEALELMKQKKSAEAEAAFLSLSKDFPEFSGPQANLGILFAKSKRRDAAIAAFTRAATANGQNAAAFNWLGILNREANNFDRARLSYEKAIAIKPDYAAAHLNLGLLLEDAMKQPAAAVVHYKEYQRLTGGKDLRVLPWIAEIESRQPKSAAAPIPAPASVEKEVK